MFSFAGHPPLLEGLRDERPTVHLNIALILILALTKKVFIRIWADLCLNYGRKGFVRLTRGHLETKTKSRWLG